MSLSNKQKVSLRHVQNILKHWDKTTTFNSQVQETIISEDVESAENECGLSKGEKINLKLAVTNLLNVIRKIE